MFVRRMATVTICAPEASTAARVSSKSRYFPVPMSRREAYGRPAMTNGSFSRSFIGIPLLASADRDDDLQAVAVVEQRAGVRAPGHDLAVTLHGDLLARHLQVLQERPQVERLLEPVGRAVYHDLDHAVMISLKIRVFGAGVVQWQNGSFPSCIRGFDSLRPLQTHSRFSGRRSQVTSASRAETGA